MYYLRDGSSNRSIYHSNWQHFWVVWGNDLGIVKSYYLYFCFIVFTAFLILLLVYCIVFSDSIGRNKTNVSVCFVWKYIQLFGL